MSIDIVQYTSVEEKTDDGDMCVSLVLRSPHGTCLWLDVEVPSWRVDHMLVFQHHTNLISILLDVTNNSR